MFSNMENMERRPDVPENPDKKRKLENGSFNITLIKGGSRKSTEKSKKPPTARRRGSSKARKARTTRRR